MNRLLHEGNDDAPRFDIPTENELLKLKLKAEFGAECTTGNENIPALVVNEFLRSVYEFEQKFRAPHTTVRIFEKLGQPFFRKEEEMNDVLITAELKRLKKLLDGQRLQLDILGDYPERLIYKFITEELFQVEMDNIDMPGFIHHFCYEDFHPNHELDIRQRVVEFLSQWFSKQINEFSWQLADPFVLPDTREIERAVVLKKITNIFDSYRSFMNCEYLVSHLEFEWDHRRQTGRAFVQGKVRYDARLENGEVVHVEGPYEFYLANTANWWGIFYFVFPGFKW